MFSPAETRTPVRMVEKPLYSTPKFTTPVNPPPGVSSKSCIPRPLFQEEETFSTKKEKREGGLFRPPPRPPAKSCPPKSRVFRHRNLLKTQAVSFNNTADKFTSVTESPLHSSAVYDQKKDESYFQQAFNMDREVGAGYFGTVYKVHSKEDGQPYAVKIAREMYRGPSDRSRKLEEVRKHQFLPPHSNLVRFYHSWEEKGRLYQQFELCQGSLQDLGQQGSLPEQTVWSYMVDLLLAVQHLHDHDLVHMDIKPENIFIGMDGICKLGDFGLVIDLAKGEDDGMEGDPCYLAPEVLAGRFTKACDVFSLGVTLLELATDMDLPRSGQLWHDLRSHGPDPALTTALQPELRRVIQLMMSRDPDRRPGVKQLLELPCVRRAVRARGRELAWARARHTALRLLQVLVPVLTLLLNLILAVVQPLKSLLAQVSPPSTPPPKVTPITDCPPPDCFSEDEADCTVSSSGSSLAVPFDSSPSEHQTTGSTCLTSTPHSNFFSPTNSPIQSARRGRFLARTPLLSPGKRLFSECGEEDGRSVARSSPQLSSAQRLSRELASQQAPGSLSTSHTERNEEARANREAESDDDLVIMQPKSLATTFDCFSDDD